MKPSSVANWLSTPSNISMMKNSTAHSGDSGMWMMASVKTMNARPGPSDTCNHRGREEGREWG